MDFPGASGPLLGTAPIPVTFQMAQRQLSQIKGNKRGSIMKQVIKRLLCSARLQPYWERIHRICLAGMNIGQDASVDGSGEAWIWQFLAKEVWQNEPAVVFDVGANIGDYANLLLSRFADRVALHCFEPSQKTFLSLKTRLEGYDGVKLYNFGFSGKEEKRTLFLNHETSGLASCYNRRLDHFGIHMSVKEEIQLSKIDDFCESNAIFRIDLLKLDVEGHELEVLRGAEKLIEAKSIKAIQFEFGGCNIDSRTFVQDFWYLLNPRYKIYRILTKGLAPINQYRETYEIFITTNYLAVRRD